MTVSALRNQLRAIVRVKQYRVAFQRIPTPEGLTRESELFLQVEYAELYTTPTGEIVNEGDLVSIRKKAELNKWLHGLRTGNGCGRRVFFLRLASDSQQ